MSLTVTIRQHSDDKLIHNIGNSSNERSMERVQRGVNINLDHTTFYTDIEEIETIQGEIDAIE